MASHLSQSMLQSNVTAAKVLEEQEFGVILISPSFQLSLSFLENQEFKSVCILAKLLCRQSIALIGIVTDSLRKSNKNGPHLTL